MKIKKLTTSAFFAALCCVATAVIQIPTPVAGYIHFGDIFVLLSGWLLGGYGVLAAGIGSMFADIFTGFASYAPITFLDKAAVAAVAWLICLLFKKVLPHKCLWIGLIVSALLGELVMAAGYIAYEWLLYGYAKAILNLVPYLVKGGISVAIACPLYPVMTSIMEKIGVKNQVKN